MPKSAKAEERRASNGAAILTSARTTGNWIDGLDIARAAAIFLVLLAHGAELLPEPLRSFVTTSFLRPGWWGVRIFFALSGFLIGRQILRILEARCRLDVARFLARRWLRTVPTFWLLIGIAVLLLPNQWSAATALKNAFFLQSMTSLEPSIFEVGWSLVIEEWSYLALGLLALLSTLIPAIDKRLSWNWILTGAMTLVILASIASRLHALDFLQTGRWESMKKLMALQFDSLAYGVILACILAALPGLQTPIKRFGWPISLTSLALMSWLGGAISAQFRSATEPTSWDWSWLAAAAYPMAGLLSCLLLVGLWNLSYLHLWQPFRQPVRVLAKTSYSLYLIHLPILKVPFLAPMFAISSGGLGFGLYLIASIAMGHICWLLLETPFIRMRSALRSAPSA
ncbi:acyltransferase family protein [Vulcanococcus limneticus]|uniref:acyltransferase family protein n=1 Tax=Vulcanococcus limneticus TaxID=2170428 RepID=UPI00398BF338